MFRHIVFWKFLDAAGGRPKAENIRSCGELLSDLINEIPQIRELEFGEDVLNTSASFDAALTVTFDRQEDFIVYRDHPRHIAAGDFIRSVTADRACVDYFTD